LGQASFIRQKFYARRGKSSSTPSHKAQMSL